MPPASGHSRLGRLVRARSAPDVPPFAARRRSLNRRRGLRERVDRRNVLVTVEPTGRRISAKTGPHTRKALGETLGVRVDPAHTYLFDAASGDRLAR